MSDIKPAQNITETELSDGTKIYVNDHVYLAPEHLGEPYYIGRVMEFCTSHKRKGLQVRIAWFNRLKDVINRKSADPCLLVATMHSDINPVSSIRGKCTVMHKYYVPNIDVYRKQQDHFYYNQLYDRYIQRVYDVVPCETVQNVPMETLEALKSRYQFIVVEQGKAADLTVARRTCCVCGQWCQSAVSVKCAGCQKSYHMSCLNPPLVRKPSKGFAWQCAFCTRQEALLAAEIGSQSPAQTESSKASSPDVESQPSPSADARRQIRATRSQVKHQQQQETLSNNAVAENTLSDTSVRKTKTLVKKEPLVQQMNMTHMWPFRYFGVNTAIRDILDVDDRIYPRAKSRIGSKYQAFVPDYDPTNHQSLSSPASSELNSPTSRSKSKKIRSSTLSSKKSAEASPEPDFDRQSHIPVRGGDDTITIIYRPGILNDEQVDDYMSSVKQLDNIPLPPHNADLMDRALYELELNHYHTDIAYDNMSRLNGDDFKHVVEWSPKEIAAFEQSIRDHGHDLNYAKSSVKTKSMADIVRFFYQWKKTDRYEPVYSAWTKIYRPLKRFKKFPRDKPTEEKVKSEDEHEEEVDCEEDTDPTIVPRATYATKSYQCMNCLTYQSKIWRRSPSDFDRKRKVFNKVLCNDCGIFWLKYAKIKPIAPETRIANVAQSSGTSATVNNSSLFDNKRKRVENGLTSRKKLKEEQEVHPTECRVCNEMGPLSRLYTCYQCGMSVHNDCYGIPSKIEKAKWCCDPCYNKKHPVSSYTYECVLCFNSQLNPQPLKMTSGYYWAHVQCAVFIPEIKFVHPSQLSPVEYIGCVNPARLEANCSLCSETRGACVACSDCRKTMHVQCAVEHEYTLAFEIQSNTHSSNKSKFPVIPAGLFDLNSPSGIMVPHVLCPGHDLLGRKLIKLSSRTTDESHESSLITYAKTFKVIPPDTTPAMRRFRATCHLAFKSAGNKIPSAREAALEALELNEPSSLLGSIRVSKITARVPSSSSTSSKRVCAAEGCSAVHSPIWRSMGPYSDKFICQRCYHKSKTGMKHA